jgi:hypothetical protein
MKTGKELITHSLKEEIKVVILRKLSSQFSKRKPTNSICLRAAMSDLQNGLRQL